MYLAVRFVSTENEESESFRKFCSEFKTGFILMTARSVSFRYRKTKNYRFCSVVLKLSMGDIIRTLFLRQTSCLTLKGAFFVVIQIFLRRLY